MDLVGPFRVSANKNKYILTFIDKLTKYVDAVPIPDATAATCAREYATRVVARHEAGQTVVTDRGASFMALFFNEVCKILGIRHLNTSAYHPQGNGVVERFHRTLHKSLSHYINESGTNWDTLLPFFIMAYHGCPHSSTGYTPYYLLHGREMILPTNQNLRAKLDVRAKATGIAPRLENLSRSLWLAYKTVRENLNISYQKNKKYYDRKAKDRAFKTDDIFYLYDPAKKSHMPKKLKQFGMVRID
jgi:transposase InsO family protein